MHSVVVGTPDLRKTALYTAEFCRAVAKCLLEAPLPGVVFGMSDVNVGLSCLETMTEGELESDFVEVAPALWTSWTAGLSQDLKRPWFRCSHSGSGFAAQVPRNAKKVR